MNALWTPQYYQKVLATNPIAYWMLDEKSGTGAYELVSGRVAGAQNGTHTGVTLVQPGIGDGRTSPFYDGTNDYSNVFTAALAAAFDGDVGTLMCWGKVNAVGAWTDGVDRALAVFYESTFVNRLWLYKFGGNNFRCLYRAGGVNRVIDIPTTTVDWFCAGITWSASLDEVKGYWNGAQSGATLNGLGVWGAAINRAIVGAQTTVPATPWIGYGAHCVLWDRVLVGGEMASLAIVE
jgi:hypothetical protein